MQYFESGQNQFFTLIKCISEKENLDVFVGDFSVQSGKVIRRLLVSGMGNVLALLSANVELRFFWKF